MTTDELRNVNGYDGDWQTIALIPDSSVDSDDREDWANVWIGFEYADFCELTHDELEDLIEIVNANQAAIMALLAIMDAKLDEDLKLKKRILHDLTQLLDVGETKRHEKGRFQKGT